MGQYRPHLPNGNQNACYKRPERHIGSNEKLPWFIKPEADKPNQSSSTLPRPAATDPVKAILTAASEAWEAKAAVKKTQQEIESRRVREAIERYRRILNAAGITQVNQQANILAQIKEESGFKPRSESLKYRPERLMRIFPKYFKDLDDAKKVAKQGEEAIANRVYGGRMGNKADEGYKFRGRGDIQLTGRQNYERLGKLIGMEKELLANPDLANDPEIAAKIVVAYIKDRVKTKDLTSIENVTKAVGPADTKHQIVVRRQHAADIKKILQDLPPLQPERGLPPRPERPDAAPWWHPPLLYPNESVPMNIIP